MRTLNGKRIKDFVGKREIILFIGAAIISQIVTSISNEMPLNIMPNLALCPVIGILFGPFASLGVNLVSFVDNVTTGIPMEYCLIDLVTVFLTSYIPYRLWYINIYGNLARNLITIGGPPPHSSKFIYH